MQVSRYPLSADGTPLDLTVGVLTDASGNNGQRTANVQGPDGAPIDSFGLVLVDKFGNAAPVPHITEVATRAAMAALTGVSDLDIRYLTEAGREGTFVYRLTSIIDLTGAAAADIFNVRYVAGILGTWVRKFDGQDLTPEMAGAAGTGLADDAPRISAALSYGNVTCDPTKTYGINQAVLVPSYRRLNINGATIRMLATYVAVGGVNAVVGSNATIGAQVMGPGLLDANKVGIGLGLPFRQNGVMMLNAQRFRCEGYIVQNCTGYANFAQGSGATQPSGVFRQIDVYNAEIHFEQMQCKGITVEDCRSFDGDGDIACSSVYHPVFNVLGNQNIHYNRNVASVAASVLIEITGSGGVSQKNITVTDCRLTNTSAAVGLSVAGGAGHDEIRLVNSEINCVNGVGTNLQNVTGFTATGCRFVGKATAFQFNATKADLVGCEFVCTAGGVTAFGISNSGGNADAASRVNVRGGVIDVTGTAGAYFVSGAGIRLDRSVHTFYNGAVDGPAYLLGAGVVDFSTVLVQHMMNRTLVLNAGFAQTVNLPQYSSIPWEIGTEIDIVNTDTMAKTVQAGAGATVTGGAFSLAPRGRVKAIVTAASVFSIAGVADLTAALAAKANLAGGNAFTGAQTITDADLTVASTSGPANIVINPAGTFASFTMKGAGSTANGANFLAGGAALYTSADVQVERNAAQSVNFTNTDNTGFAITTGVLKMGVNTVIDASRNGTFGSVSATGNVTSSGGVVGYATGAGGTVAQITSKATAVTLNKVCGQFTTNNAALAAAGVVTFQVNDSNIIVTDTINLNLQSGQATNGTYRYWIEKVNAGSFLVTIENRSAGSLSEALTFNYSTVRSVAS